MKRFVCGGTIVTAQVSRSWERPGAESGSQPPFRALYSHCQLSADLKSVAQLHEATRRPREPPKAVESNAQLPWAPLERWPSFRQILSATELIRPL